MKNPHTPAEWQEAVNTAHVMRAIADCEMYGLIEFRGKGRGGLCRQSISPDRSTHL
jgi:hypothetical protein